MRVAAMILGLLGSLAILFFGAVWIADYNKSKDDMASLQKIAARDGADDAISRSFEELRNNVKAAYAMVGLGIISLVASFVVFRLATISGLLMLTAVIIPAVLAPKTLLFSFLLSIAGILALLSLRRAQ